MEKVFNYVKENKSFIAFVICNLITTTVLRFLTVKNYYNLKPFLVDLGILIILGSFSYLFKNKKRFIYLFSITIICSLICFINSIYYSNYLSYASVSLIGSLAFLKDVGDAVVDNILELKDFIFLLQIPVFFLLNHKENKNNYCFKESILTGIILLALIAPFYKGRDYARLWKQWNREHIVMQFGIILYQLDDFVVSVKPGLVNLFGADTALKSFREYYDKNEVYLLAASSADELTTREWLEEIHEFFPDMEILCDKLSLGISCHTGEGALGIGCSCRPKRIIF